MTKEYTGCRCSKSLRRTRPEDEALGAWMSAALDDPRVCDQMKRDIEAWFSTFIYRE